MKSENLSIILITCPADKTAETIAEHLIKLQLAACVNIVPNIKSIYTWEGAVHKDSESLLLIKSKKSLLAELEKEIISKHPYDTPEFVVLDVDQVNDKYLDWAMGCLK